MKAIKVLGIAPYLGLKKLLETTARQQPDIQLTCFVGDLEAGLDIAVREIEQHDFDIIISRGGTATLLKEHMTLPVIDVGVSQYDIMQMLQSSREYMGKRALVGFQSITTSAGVVAEILQDDIAIFTIHQQNEVRGLLQVLKSEGFDTVLGDMITTRAAKEVGLNYVQVVSSSESIERGLMFARLLGHQLQQKKANDRLLSSTAAA
ncbi:PrpR N-terminal domain-containing protein [Listeria grayi]|uniref:PrpR N-terminal domain-containing protein n=1 Tax=Listeria grayi TaxID=1641 RepID=UPI0004AE6481|nr:PrpR N-terminal domain-containing protein [Listeria grayi]